MSKINELFQTEIKVVNLGIEAFFNDLQSQKVETIHVAWKPVAGGNKKLASMLDLLK